MPILPRLPLIVLTHITQYLASQDGSKTQKQLLPSLAEHISRRHSANNDVDSLSTIITKIQHEARRIRAVQKATAVAELHYSELQERLASTRLTAVRRAVIERENAGIIRAYNNRKILKTDKWTQVEERLVAALTALKERNNLWAAEKEKAKQEDKERKEEQKKQEKKEKEEKKAAEKEEKQKAEQAKRDREAELKARQTDVRAMQTLDAKAKQLDLEKERQEEAARRKRIDAKLETLLDLFIDNAQHTKRQRRDETAESDSDKENVRPEGQWQA